VILNELKKKIKRYTSYINYIRPILSKYYKTRHAKNQIIFSQKCNRNRVYFFIFLLSTYQLFYLPFCCKRVTIFFSVDSIISLFWFEGQTCSKRKVDSNSSRVTNHGISTHKISMGNIAPVTDRGPACGMTYIPLQATTNRCPFVRSNSKGYTRSGSNIHTPRPLCLLPNTSLKKY
jgi:hypothetical protein